MPSQAPIVVRHGAVLLHISDPVGVGSVLDSLSRSSMLQPPTDTTNVVLIVHETAAAEVRRAIVFSKVSAAAASPKETGRDDFAKRLRTSARARGAAAHRDGALVQDIRTAYDEARASEAWRPEYLDDGRRLRLKGSEVVPAL